MMSPEHRSPAGTSPAWDAVAWSRKVPRRQFLRDAAGTTAALVATPLPVRGRRRRGRRSVAVLGAGVAGLTAAHELSERGFDVVVYERKALGGKSRSIPVARTGRDGRRDLPGEHGLRFFPGFYHHVPDTMRRIPYPGNAYGVYDNLVAAASSSFARSGAREDLVFPSQPQPLALDSLEQALIASFAGLTTVPRDELELFVRRLAIFFTSSDARRFGQWDNVSWWDYLRAERKSQEYRRLLVTGLTRNFVAAKPELASTRTIGRIVEAFAYGAMGRGNDGDLVRVLNGPTSEAWIDPWIEHLRRLGVRFRSAEVETLELRRGRVASARVRDTSGRCRMAEADWFVCAMPVERARRLWSREVLAADPRLRRMWRLRTAWANGIQFYLRREVPVVHGHISYVDSPWALTSISQAQMWEGRVFPRDYGDGAVRDCLSVTVSNWEEPGILYGKPAARCTPRQIAREVWAQVKEHLEDTGRSYLPEDVLHSWFLDPAISYASQPRRNPGVRARNEEPLLLNAVGSWKQRPGTWTAIPNLFLAADYVRVDIDLATMEGANEAARQATNALLLEAGSCAEPVRTYRLYRAPELKELKRLDAERFRRGQPHILATAPPH
jgi:uncharacterized protein with NAD-binding domain and iron-sulfur cluster